MDISGCSSSSASRNDKPLLPDSGRVDRLVLTYPNDAEKTCPGIPMVIELGSDRAQVKLGRSPECEEKFSASDPTDMDVIRWVSRIHCTLFRRCIEDEVHLYIQDNAAKNGVWINKTRIGNDPVRLKEGDVITLGSSDDKHGPEYVYVVDSDCRKRTRSLTCAISNAVNSAACAVVSHVLDVAESIKKKHCPYSRCSSSSTSMCGTLPLAGSNETIIQENASSSCAPDEISLEKPMAALSTSDNAEQAKPSICSGNGAFFSNPASSSTEIISHLHNELTCTICCCPFVHACTLACSHSFCSCCITKWLKSSQSCPICRTCVLQPPVRSRCLDSAVTIGLQHASEDTRREWNRRKCQCDEKDRLQKENTKVLEDLMHRAKEEGIKVVSITNIWSEQEQNRFLSNVSLYEGEARVAYCAVVGLTPEFVGRANVKELFTAAKKCKTD